VSPDDFLKAYGEANKDVYSIRAKRKSRDALRAPLSIYRQVLIVLVEGVVDPEGKSRKKIKRNKRNREKRQAFRLAPRWNTDRQES